MGDRRDLQDETVFLLQSVGLGRATLASARVRGAHALTRRRGGQKVKPTGVGAAVGYGDFVRAPPNVTRKPLRPREVVRSDSGALRIGLNLNNEAEACHLVPQVAQPRAGEQGHRCSAHSGRRHRLLQHEVANRLLYHAQPPAVQGESYYVTIRAAEATSGQRRRSGLLSSGRHAQAPARPSSPRAPIQR